jgi:plastocyanin
MSPVHRFRRLLAALALVSTACTAGGSPGQAQTRTVRVDHNFDEFAGSFLAYFPQEIDARPGDTIQFKQDWTGEGHSVTLGTLVDKAILPVRNIIRSGNIPDQPPPEVQDALKVLPEMLGDDYTVNQAAAEPCYLDTGAPPTDPSVACPKREQPAFNGRQTYYSSGLIPFQGTEGNRFELRLADDIKPGTYTFYCTLHGPLQSGEIHVKAKGSKVPSQAAVDRQGQAELHKLADPLAKAFADAKAGKGLFEGQPLRGNLAGVATDNVRMAYIDEFVPNRINTKVGEKVTWTFVGPHTVSFDVPPYFPEFLVARDGVVTFNPKAHQAFGGPGEPPPRASPEDPLPAVDAGRWDGSYVISSGMFTEGTYSLTFTKPGRYRYACLVHPRMVGEVVVS